MVLAPDRRRIFISYSHKDQKYLKELLAHLANYEQKGSTDFWDDTRITSGSRWYREIEKAIASAKAAILLVSPDYLASEFIAKNELTPLLVASKDKGIKIFPVILRPCDFENTPLAPFQSINSSSKPLSSMNKSRREAVWEKVAERVQDSLASIATTPQTSSALSLSTRPSVNINTTPSAGGIQVIGELPAGTEIPIRHLYAYRGHTARINAVRWSPDGEYIASASDDHTVQIWDAITGRHAATYDRGGGFDLAIAWSPDGKYIVVGGDNKTVHIIDALTGNPQFSYLSDAHVVAAIDWSPDGKYLALGSANMWPYRSDEDIVEVIDSLTGKEVFTHRSHIRATATLAWSPDSKYLASASYEGLVEVFDVGNTSLSDTYHGISDQINAVLWSPDGRYIAAGGVDSTVVVWDTSTKDVVSTYRGHSGAVLTISWAPNGQYIASAGEGQNVQVWNVHTAETVQTYYGHSGTVFSVVWSPDGQRIASAGQDKTVQIWQVGFAATEESKEQWLQAGDAIAEEHEYSSLGNVQASMRSLKEAKRPYQKVEGEQVVSVEVDQDKM